jgi:hypothetical protein
MGIIDNSKHSSTAALIAAATVVIALLIVSPVILDMYLTTNKNNKVMEYKTKQVDEKIEQLEQLKKEILNGRNSQTKVDLPDGSNIHDR